MPVTVSDFQKTAMSKKYKSTADLLQSTSSEWTSVIKEKWFPLTNLINTNIPSGEPLFSFVSPGKQGKWHILPRHQDLCGNEMSTTFPSQTRTFHEEQINTIKALSFQLLLCAGFPSVQQDSKPSLMKYLDSPTARQLFSQSSKLVRLFWSEWISIVLVVWLCSRTILEQQSTWGPPCPWSDKPTGFQSLDTLSTNPN